MAWLSMGLFLALALYSFDPLDPSFNSIGRSLSVTNFCGYVGSFISDALYQFMGLTSWVLVIALFRVSHRSFLGARLKLKGLRVLWASLLILTVSSLLELHFPETKFFSGQITTGGLIGVVVSKLLVQMFNVYGVSVILWSSALILLVFYTERPIKELILMPYDVVKSIYYLYQDTYAGEWIKEAIRGCGELFRKIPIRRLAHQVTAGGLKNTQKSEALSEGATFFKIKKEEDLDLKNEAASSPESEAQYSIDFDLEKKESEEQRKSQKRKVHLKAKVSRHVENWELPKLSTLEDPPLERKRVDEKEIRIKSELLVDKLAQFNVGGKVVGIKPGPAVTMFEFKPNIDVKISKITELADDLCLALSSESVRIIAPIPGRDVVGIETSNSHQETVYLKDIIAEESFWDEDCRIPIPLGRQADGDPKVVDLRKMPHLLVAGTTGSGKSVFVVSTLVALLFKHSPKTLRLILIDPKQVDLAVFNSVPHLLMPPICEPKKAVVALRWSIREMEKRYRSMAKFGARDLESYNEKIMVLDKAQKEEHRLINEQFEEENKSNQTYYYEYQPLIVLVIEEFGDLMAVDKQNVEHGVVRLAQMARASGIHLILAMQSPRKDVVTGLIKTNIPGRISFKVASKLDSRVILDESGAERLLARGDMLFLAPGVSKPGRHHGAWLSESEITEVVQKWSSQGEPEYDPLAMRALEGSGGGFDLSPESTEEDEEYDERYDEILSWASEQKTVSASLIQRKFRLGYPRAARLIEVMETEGVVGPSNGSKPREVLISSYQEA